MTSPQTRRDSRVARKQWGKNLYVPILSSSHCVRATLLRVSRDARLLAHTYPSAISSVDLFHARVGTFLAPLTIPRGGSQTHLPFGRLRTQVTSPKKHPKASDIDAGSGTAWAGPCVVMNPSNEPMVGRSLKFPAGTPTSETPRWIVNLPPADSNGPVPPVMVIVSVTN